MIQQQKTRQEQRRSDEEQTGQPQGAKSEIDEDSLAETLADLDEALAEHEAAEEAAKTAAREAAIAAFHALDRDDEEAVKAFNARNEQLGFYAMTNCCGCGCDFFLYENDELYDYARD